MPIDEVKFGELIGTVGSLVTAVADMKGAVLPALKEIKGEICKDREDCRARQDKQQEEYDATYIKVINIDRWMRGDESETGAKKELKKLVDGKTRLMAFMGGITIAGGAAGHKISQLADSIWSGLK